MEETRRRIAKLYREGKWNQDDEVAKKWSQEYVDEAPKKEKKKVEKKEKE